MNSDPVSIIERQLEAYNRHDLDGFLACYSPDAELIDQMSGAVIARGRAEIRPLYEQRFKNPSLHGEIANRIVLGRIVIDHEHIAEPPVSPFREAVVIYQVGSDFIERAWIIRKEQDV